eukprot:Hpha_TRINITY_DN14684_c0_g1::TRINITY_DN14684_c0_g1_i1::g.47875::m.47875
MHDSNSDRSIDPATESLRSLSDRNLSPPGDRARVDPAAGDTSSGPSVELHLWCGCGAISRAGDQFFGSSSLPIHWNTALRGRYSPSLFDVSVVFAFEMRWLLHTYTCFCFRFPFGRDTIKYRN